MRLCHVHDIPDGGARGFDTAGAGQDTLFVVRRGEQLLAYVNSCPHHDTPLAWRRDAYLNAAGDRIVCAAHGALFEIDTGRCTLGPCLGDALTPLALRTDPDGEVHLAPPQDSETTP
ncbi:MAG: (2Fe-2S)-binding protein [Burkholderiales bacterium PBB6]|nr:MAG: (2Fe-2S)-binding protein [Burkholderiales bacterium PBB6]